MLSLKSLRFIYRAFRYRFLLDRHEVNMMLHILEQGDLVIDAGAHKGAYTFWMRKATGETGDVITFEPQPELARDLRRVMQDVGWQDVIVENIGLSSSNGTVDLHVPETGPSPGATFTDPERPDKTDRVQVAVTALDTYLQSREIDNTVRLIKCDVEGHELEVFRGARNILLHDRPVLLFESEVRHNPDRPIGEVFSFLEQLNYHGYFFWNRRLRPLSEFIPETHQTTTSQPYVNNFLFYPDS